MMKCMREPIGWSGSQWKTLRWSQYSDSVQMREAGEDQERDLDAAHALVRCQATISPTITGT